MRDQVRVGRRYLTVSGHEAVIDGLCDFHGQPGVRGRILFDDGSQILRFWTLNGESETGLWGDDKNADLVKEIRK